MRFLCFAFFLSLFLSHGLQAQTLPGRFDNYEAMRAELDELIRDRRVTQMLERFSYVPEGERQNFMALEMQVRNLMPNPLTNSYILAERDYGNGFRQQVLAHHDDATGYLFTRLMIHDRGEGALMVVQFATNTNPFQMLGAP